MEDDAMHGFSSGDEGVDLLSSILDRECSKSGVENHVVCRRKKTSQPSNKASDSELEIMKSKLKSMESELTQLRQLVASKERPHVQANQKEASERPASTDRRIVPSTPTCIDDGICDRGVSLMMVKQRNEDAQKGVFTETYSGLRIRNPLVSSDQMKQRMEGRKMVRIPNIGAKLRGTDIEGDWVTIGVIVDKLPPKDTAKKEKFSVWKLSDLSSQKSVLSLFLFGKAFQEHWKTPTGHILALLNPSVMPNKESGEVDKNNLALSVDHPQRLMLMGVSEDFTLCKANTKTGKKCTNFASKSEGGYCDYHLQGAYNKMRSQRMECQRGYGPSASTLHEKLFQKSKTEVFFYGGQSFTASRGGSGVGGGPRTPPSTSKASAKLFAPGARESVAMATTEVECKRHELGVHRDRNGVVTHEPSDLVKQVVKSHSMGAQYLSMQKMKEASKTETIKTASQLLQEHSLKVKIKAPPIISSTAVRAGGDLFAPDNSQGSVSRDSVPGSIVQLIPEAIIPTVEPSPLSSAKRCSVECASSVSRVHLSTPDIPLTRELPLPPTPCAEATERASGTAKMSAAKLKALAIVRHKGGLQCGGQVGSSSSTNKDAVLKRVLASQSEGSEDTESKKPKLDIDSPDVQSILHAKSSHDWLVKEEEWGTEQAYFEQLEKKEAMEDKLKTLKELSVSVVQCKQCKYVAEGAGELCKRQNHSLVRFRAVKRFFECQNCKERCATFNNKYPTKPCRKCGVSDFKQTCVWRERQGPKLPSETLLLRGEEIKFLNGFS